MNASRLTLGLTVLNLTLLVIVLVRGLPRPAATAEPESVPVLRGRSLEIVDEGGRIRSSLKLEPDGEVVLRLVDRRGTIRVKLGAGEDGSGLLLLDETIAPGVHLVARRAATAGRPTTTSVTVRGAGGRQRVLRP